MRRLLALLVVLTACLGLGLTAPAYADHGGTHYTGDTGDHDVELGGEHETTDVDPGTHQTGGGGTTAPPPVAVQVYGYVTACMLSATPDNDPGVMCTGATTCPEEGDIRYRQFVRTEYSDGRPPTQWEMVAVVCRGADDPVDTEPRITTDMVVDAARAVAPTATVVVQPGARSFVNIPNNYYTQQGAETVPVTLFGQTIQVVFTPTTYTWSFGDGASGTGAGKADAPVGDPEAVEHAYARQGTYPISVAVGFAVAFTLPDGTQGTGQVTGPPGQAVQLPVGEVQTRVTETT